MISTLKRLRRRWRFTNCAAVLLRVFALGIAMLIAFAVLDRVLMLGETFLRTYRALGLLVCLLIVASEIIRSLRISLKATAIRADRTRQSGRARCRSALELAQTTPRNEFESYLIDQQTSLAVQQMDELQLRKFLPMNLLRRAAFLAVLALVSFGLLQAFWGIPLRTALRRLRHPQLDLPPYSPYTFTITPANPATLYGGNIELAAEITGAPLRDQQVHLVSRNNTTQNSIPCFQDGDHRYVQQLNRLTQPITFCFRVGRARSPWIPVELLLQPQIEDSVITLTPPTYSRLPQQSFPTGEREIQALRRSSAQLDIRSNRPVLDGTLAVSDGQGRQKTLAGLAIDMHTIRFNWTIENDATLSAEIRDVRGTSCANPLHLSQSVLPDEPPEITLLSPGTRVLATPESTIPLAVTASDDIGLQEIFFVRTVDSFRDRETTIASDLTSTDFSWEDGLDLSRLGLRPGQVIECYMEAQDNNPTLDGITASSIGSIEIISVEDYAEMIRMQTDIREFVARFSETRRAMQQVIEKLRELKESTLSGDQDEMAKKKEAVLNSIKNANALYNQLKDDYAVFDEEKTLTKTMTDAMKSLESARSMIQLTATPIQAGNMAMAVDMALDELQPASRELDKHHEDAKQLAAVAKVMECAARIRRLMGLQEQILRRLQRYQDTTPQRRLSALRQLGDNQMQIKQEYQSILHDITAGADKLPPGYKTLHDSARMFTSFAKSLNIDIPMQGAADSARQGRGEMAYQNASEAMELLYKLLSGNCDGEFNSMCQQRFRVPDYRKTLKQMLKSMCNRYGTGQQPGYGTAAGGEGTDGYWQQGYGMPVPMIGPQRSSFRNDAAGTVQGQQGGAGVAGPSATSSYAETMTTTIHEEPAGENRSSGETPSQYRDAIRRYFSDD